MAEKTKKRILKIDPYLAPFERDINERVRYYKKKRSARAGANGSLVDFANAHAYFGFHRVEGGWVYREWAPAAEAMYLTGDFNAWDLYACPMERRENGVFEVFVDNALTVGSRVQAIVIHQGKTLRRIPLFATRVVQDADTYLWCAELEDTLAPYPWTDKDFCPSATPLIYEAHVGMSEEKGAVATYREFTEHMLPRIKRAGYNTVQLMAVMEHPYYGSFGYQVSNFFAASSRYGTSDDLKALIDCAHSMGIAVLLDVVHSHAAKNTDEGLCEFDGTVHQFFHEGERGDHSAWGTKLFDYGKHEVLHFLLSNLKYWMEIFHFDGFRFDGVTSMLYRNHGLDTAFTEYSMYFSDNTDKDAVLYLQLANELVHTMNGHALTVAEDMSGMPGMCLPVSAGGIGFDYRLSMGVPDMWIKLLKECRDEDWDMGWIWHELTTRRPSEANIGYCESHDQALVGDKTIMFRLCDAEMYTHMSKFTPSAVIDRGMALHKMIRLVTATLAGEGYLNFMGNEFGHPEWIDFPREGNGWSHHYCRRQWSLSEDTTLRYGELLAFDAAMISLLSEYRVLGEKTVGRWVHQNDKVMIYQRGDLIFAFNFHPTDSHTGYYVPVGRTGTYRVLLSTDERRFGGFDRASTTYRYQTQGRNGNARFACYLPARTALVFKHEK